MAELDNIPHYLYKITNQINSKIYIGVTNNPSLRYAQHKSDKERLVGKAILKYGKDNFKFEIICIGNKEYIYELESKVIVLYNSDATTGHGYNLCTGGKINNQINRGKKIKKRKDDKSVYVSGWWFPNKRTALLSLDWKTGLYNSRVKSNTLGEVQFIKTRQGPQNPVYVSGFWFPSKKMAVYKINITPNVYEKRRKDGTLGNILLPKRKSNSTVLAKPCYFKGFWFPDVFTAGGVFEMKPETIRQRILRGSFEENSSVSKLVTERYSNKLYNKEVQN